MERDYDSRYCKTRMHDLERLLAAMTHIENIRTNDHVVLLHRKGTESLPYRNEILGIPLRVCATAAPYLLVEGVGKDKRARTIDLRLWDVSKCERKYVDAFKVTDFLEAIETPRVPQCPVCERGRWVFMGDLWRCSECGCMVVDGEVEV